MRKVAGRLRLELSQYRELEAFAQFGSDLDADTQARSTAAPAWSSAQAGRARAWPIEDQVAAIYSGTGGYLDRIKVERVREFLQMLLAAPALRGRGPDGADREGNWDDSIEERLGNCIAEAIDDFGPDFDAEGNPIEEGESDRVTSARGAREGSLVRRGRRRRG